ncbi:ROK family transcriptional regulator [Clostridium manihotivorum]|uniref:ROK family transcriptional regulator n=1 Tax=Clostridium manihotivorum TaxID=2320868 RepID=A0A410DV50_9CLOT|nr:ROK family transcriptional regulator [Clostridium manihotivorum]QAA33083.1 ROK family transcriptional regulator [Clostridium manihotivorum]
MIKVNNVDKDTIRSSNIKLIINLLFNKRELTKQEIAKETGLSIPTVINITNELIEEGLVEESGVGQSSGGRKPIIITFNPNSKYSFGVEINSKYIRIILTNLDANILEDEVIRFNGAFKLNENNITNIFDEICKIIKVISLKRNIKDSSILGVGFSLPGTVNEEKLFLELAPNLYVKNLDFHYIEEKLNMKVYVENEANSAALAELRLGIAKDMRNLVYISIREGVGTGIVVSGYLYKGKNKRAGEFGHMTVEKDGRVCTCGKKGCWEVYTSSEVILEEYNVISKNKVKSFEEFFKLIDTVDKNAMKVWDKYLDYLAIGIHNIILIMDPHYIVLGGDISEYDKYLIEPLKNRIFQNNNFFCEEDLKIITSRFKENSSIIGASILPIEKLFFINERIL